MSLYDELGGSEAIQAALDRFYEKVMADPPVATFFDGLDVDRIKAKQQKFWAIALGGEAEYDGRDLSTAHAGPRGQGLDESLFHRFVGHFRSTLEEFGVPEDKIEQAMAVTDRHKGEVLGN
jgi:hemoglobin